MATPMIKRTTYFDKRESRWVTVLLDRARNRVLHHKHPRTIQTKAAATKAGKAVDFPRSIP